MKSTSKHLNQYHFKKMKTKNRIKSPKRLETLGKEEGSPESRWNIAQVLLMILPRVAGVMVLFCR